VVPRLVGKTVVMPPIQVYGGALAPLSRRPTDDPLFVPARSGPGQGGDAAEGSPVAYPGCCHPQGTRV